VLTLLYLERLARADYATKKMFVVVNFSGANASSGSWWMNWLARRTGHSRPWTIIWSPLDLVRRASILGDGTVSADLESCKPLFKLGRLQMVGPQA